MSTSDMEIRTELLNYLKSSDICCIGYADDIVSHADDNTLYVNWYKQESKLLKDSARPWV